MSSQLVRLRNDWTSIREAAITVSSSFSNDPLIQWFRPDAQPWGDLDDGSLRFQHRRLQRMNEEFVVFGLPLSPATDQQRGQVIEDATTKTESCGNEELDFAVVAMLEPPQEDGLSLRQIWIRFKYWILDTISPCKDPGCDDKRFEIMMEAHNNGLERLRRELHPRKPWYLEVIAVRPSLQGRGLGGQMMRGLIDLAGDSPIVLECTDRSTIGFYQKYGFNEVRDMCLDDPLKPDESMKCTWMVRK